MPIRSMAATAVRRRLVLTRLAGTAVPALAATGCTGRHRVRSMHGGQNLFDPAPTRVTGSSQGGLNSLFALVRQPLDFLLSA